MTASSIATRKRCICMATKARGFHRSSLIFGAGSGRNRLGQADSTPWLPADGMERSLAVAHHYLNSYMGEEIIAVTAGEAEHPEVTIPRAMRNIVWRPILFYVAASAIMVAMVPWNHTTPSTTVSSSPFVSAFVAANVSFAATIMNFAVLTAALSSVNTNLYLSTRMLFSLGQQGYTPRWMGKVSRNGVPHPALLASTAGIIAAILLAIVAPKNAFLMLYGAVVAGVLFGWLILVNPHLRFRKALPAERLLRLPVRLRVHPLFTLAGILLIIAIAVTTFVVDGLRRSKPPFAVFLVLISLLYSRIRAQGSGVQENG